MNTYLREEVAIESIATKWTRKAAAPAVHGSSRQEKVSAPALLELVDLHKEYKRAASFAGDSRIIRAVDGISITVEERQTVAIVGESGCGKTTTAKMALLLEKPTSGSIRFYGKDISMLSRAERRHYRRSVQAVFQDPYSSLSPRMRIRDIVGEPLQIHEGLRGKELAHRVDELLDRVGLDREKSTRFPHQFSGGQRQRIAIARALSLNPKLVVLDEPVSALDVSIRAQVLNLLADLQEEFGLSYLLISHDLAVVEFMSHKVAVMYAGRIVESAPADDLYAAPRHPYTGSLLAAVPRTDPDVPLTNIVGGDVPDPGNLPDGCRFHPRCPLYEQHGKPSICTTEPILSAAGNDRLVACHFRTQVAQAAAS